MSNYCSKGHWENGMKLPCKQCEIEQLTARVRELEEENARLRFALADTEALELGTSERLVASQAYAEQLREALEGLKPLAAYGRVGTRDIEQAEFQRRLEVLTAPRDTSALDAYVAERVKEYQERLADALAILGADSQIEAEVVMLNYKKQVSALTRQRDLAVEALEKIAAPVRGDGTYNRCREACEILARETLSAIKESDGK